MTSIRDILFEVLVAPAKPSHFDHAYLHSVFGQRGRIVSIKRAFAYESWNFKNRAKTKVEQWFFDRVLSRK